ncbi:MAG: hypothetical protein ABH882_04585 [Candidatus Omnitrophota bacterium]|nr:hypothetical protein [Candidatus Omnitrophota bacterium]MBU1929188.1 hypothetical protein [Candidatus Omnitrophota bacterium]MBU2035479.1 hypothetical protein [Candidatus Omnitrophota bacterium]MBU2221814.1 hypothetical protein [Candidatus Omnitrophota bacterium]MBU2258127.1 hypothetical protein [Candidatus Omnitrophota bacterium]
MAQDKSLSPEKQLLSLIEGQESQNKKAVSPAAAIIEDGSSLKPKIIAKTAEDYALQHRNLSLFSVEAWIGRLSFFKGQFKKWSKVGQSQSDVIKLVNRFMYLGIFILAVYFAGNFSFSMINVNKIPQMDFKVQSAVANPVGLAGLSPIKPSSYYLEKVRQRDIFKMGPMQKDEEKQPLKIVELTKNLKLVGISWSDDPDVMIEDTGTKRTFFVKRGQSIGEIKVQAVFKDKIILSYDKEEMELK